LLRGPLLIGTTSLVENAQEGRRRVVLCSSDRDIIFVNNFCSSLYLRCLDKRLCPLIFVYYFYNFNTHASTSSPTMELHLVFLSRRNGGRRDSAGLGDVK
jgi:hypothetical protein